MAPPRRPAAPSCPSSPPWRASSGRERLAGTPEEADEEAARLHTRQLRGGLVGLRLGGVGLLLCGGALVLELGNHPSRALPVPSRRKKAPRVKMRAGRQSKLPLDR